jgi:hypothetical protein
MTARRCLICGCSLHGRRRDARCCSPACRREAARWETRSSRPSRWRSRRERPGHNERRCIRCGPMAATVRVELSGTYTFPKFDRLIRQLIPRSPRPVALIDSEIARQARNLERLRDDLTERLRRATAADGHITIVDTHVPLHHRLPDSVNWKRSSARTTHLSTSSDLVCIVRARWPFPRALLERLRPRARSSPPRC